MKEAHILLVLVLAFKFIISVQSCKPIVFIKNDQERDTGQTNIVGKPKVIRRNIYPHTISSNPQDKCECGKEVSYRKKTWNVFVFNKTLQNENVVPCLGAVIAHNLVLTSHKCLMVKGKKMRPYDGWRILPKHREQNMASIANITVQTHRRVLNVKAVIYNTQFGLYASRGDIASADDIAIIVVDGDLFMIINRTSTDGESVQEHARSPVCLPPKAKKKDGSGAISHRYGFYNGIGGKFFNDATLERRYVNELIIFDGEECDEDLNLKDFSDRDTFCTRTVSPLPTIPGGHLLTTNVNGFFIDPGTDDEGYSLPLTVPQTSFLVGIGTVPRKKEPGRRLSYTYFGNVQKNVEFIEGVAQEYGSMWCTTPPFVDTKKAEDDEMVMEEWPWETDKMEPRSETLDCACGLKNSDKTALGRVAGGVDAIPYEFGWMVKIKSTWTEDDPNFEQGAFLCGASIINDRILLTAAHCVIETDDGKNNNGVLFERVQTSEIVIGAHFLYDGNDENENRQVLKMKDFMVHPGYIPNKKDGATNFDLALILLEEPIEFATAKKGKNVGDNDIRPICLPKVGEKISLENGTVLTAMGWGILNPWIEDAAKMPQTLQKLQVPVRDIEYCINKVDTVVPETVFCMGNFTQKYGVTQGDSGGPLSIRKSNGQYFQVGTVSFGVDLDEVEWLDFIVDIQRIVYQKDIYYIMLAIFPLYL